MLKRREDFPYDFKAAYPAYPTPVMPSRPVQNPAPPPPAAAPPSADPAPPPAQDETPIAATQPTHATIPAATPPQPEPPAPKPKARIPHRRRKLPIAAYPDIPPSAVLDPNESQASRHSRKCTICNHPDRQAIDDDYLHWIRPLEIAIDYEVSEPSVRNHARATGIHELRLRKYHSALDLVIEHANAATVTGDTIIRAIRAVSCITDYVKWVEPPKRVIYSVEHAPTPEITPPPSAPELPSQPENPVLELAGPVKSDPFLIEHQGD